MNWIRVILDGIAMSAVFNLGVQRSGHADHHHLQVCLQKSLKKLFRRWTRMIKSI